MSSEDFEEGYAKGIDVGYENALSQGVLPAVRYFAGIAAPVWRFGDGNGGWVLQLLAEELQDHYGIAGKPSRFKFTSIVDRLAERDGWECHYCNHPLGIGHHSVHPPQIEHKVPKSVGGSDHISNLVLSCPPCNQQKGTTSHDTFCTRCES